MGVALSGLVIALQCLVSAAVAGWPVLAEAICRTATAHSCPPTVYQSAIYEIPIGAAATSGVLITAMLTWQYAHRLHQYRSRARAHAEAARVAGRPMSAASGAVVLDAPQPAAYCVLGRPPAIVLTTGALSLLDPGPLAAVIAHERAHLAGTHPMLVMLTRGLAAAFPGVPVFTQGTAEVTRLTEMRADDLAAPRNWLAVMVVIALLAVTLGMLIWFADPVAARAIGAAMTAWPGRA
jgi:Zn-dependent protease with chaperone function